ncbi:repressor LexA [Candidatus Uhrbacteria bacterium]|nr:repressor LexA [Candidatus Uhrbacteria bacterium]
MDALTKRQHEVLKLLYQYINTEGYPPSFDELRELLDVASNQTITDMFSALEKKGVIKREEGNARGLTITRRGFEALGVQPLLPLAGASRGGPLTEALTMTGEWRAVGKEISKLDPRQNAFLIKVHGDSMEGVIWDGDVVLVLPVRSWNDVKNRDIVLVLYEGETTVKRYVAKGGRRYLEPENPKYTPISIQSGMRLQGKIIARL